MIPLKSVDEADCGGTWSYDCLPRVGTCRIDGQPLNLNLRLEGWVKTPLDVLDVEAWFAELVKTPLTVEDVARAAVRRWGLTAFARGFAHAHGLITFRVPA